MSFYQFMIWMVENAPFGTFLILVLLIGGVTEVLRTLFRRLGR